MATLDHRLIEKGAKAIQAALPEKDIDGDGAISFKEFSAVKLPGIEEKNRGEVYRTIAGRDGDRRSITQRDLDLSLPPEPETLFDERDKLTYDCVSIQVDAAERVLKALTEQGLKHSAALKSASEFSESRETMARIATGREGVDMSDPRVQKRMSHMPLWTDELERLRSVYYGELNAMLATAKPEVIKNIADSAYQKRDHDTLGALEFALEYSVPERADLESIRRGLTPHVHETRPKGVNVPPPVLMRVLYELGAVKEIDCQIGERLVYAARQSGVTMVDKKFSEGEAYDALKKARMAEMQAAAPNPDPEGQLIFDAKWRNTVDTLSQRYEKELTHVFANATPQQLLNLHRWFSINNPQNADATFAQSIRNYGLTPARAQQALNHCQKLGYTPDATSDTPGDRFLKILSDYVGARQ